MAEKLLAFEKNRKYTGNRKRVKKKAERAKQTGGGRGSPYAGRGALRHPGKKLRVKRLVKKVSPLSYETSNCDGSGGNSYLYGKC